MPTPPPAAERIAVYPGTFDPITNGHVDIIKRSLSVFDRVIVAIAENVRKAPLFTTAERLDFLRQACAPDVASGRVVLDSFHGLLVDYCQQKGATTLIRGLRALADFEYEFQFALMNRRLAPSVDTMFLMTAEEHFYVSSSLVKEIGSFGGDIDDFVPAPVAAALVQKFQRRP